MLLASVLNLKKYYGDRLLLDIDKFEIFECDKIGLIGVNGAGKSTLIKALLNKIDYDIGTIQLTDSYSYISQDEISKCSHNDSRLKSILNAPDSFQEYLSGGEKVKLRILNALVDKKKLIIADEPTANLDKDSIKVVESMLKSHKGGLLLVSHDREMLDSLCNIIAELDKGKLKIYGGNYRSYLKMKDAEKEREKFEYNQYTKEKNRLENAVHQRSSQRDSLRKTPKRMGNSEARLHRMGPQRSKKNLDSNIKALNSRIDRLEIKEKPRDKADIKIEIQDGLNVVSRNLLEAKNLTIRIGERILLDNISFKVKKGSKTAIIGENGCGKSMLLREIVGNEHNAIKINSKVKIGYFEQDQKILRDDMSILENVRCDSSFGGAFIRAKLSLFGFRGDDVHKKVMILSGGEKVRVSLCKVILEDNNLLVLDEPTNYLDIDTIRALETALNNTDKAALIVSHDRAFISNVCESVLEIKNMTLTNNLEFRLKGRDIGANVSTSKEAFADKSKLMMLEHRFSTIISLLSTEKDPEKKKAYEIEYEQLRDSIMECSH